MYIVDRINKVVQKQPDPPLTGQSRKTSILIVDDEPDVLAIFKQSLERSGYSTYGFVNPSAALEHFEQNPRSYQMVITDVRMPVMSGFELVRGIRKMNQDVRIVLMTAFEISMSEMKTVLPSLKIDGILHKPIEFEKLDATIKMLAT